MDNNETSEFRQWCVVELFGHSVIAGEVSSQQIAGELFLRIDVPAVGKAPAYTKYFGKGAIYAMTPVDRNAVERVIQNTTMPPVQPYLLAESCDMGECDDMEYLG